MSLLTRTAVRRVQKALVDAGSTGVVVELNATARTADDAAKSCGVPVGAIIKTLAFAAGEEIVLALIAGDRRCDTGALQRVLALRIEPTRADPKMVKAATGFTIGGVAPIGHPTALPLAIDASLIRFAVLYAAAGHPHCVFATTFDEICTLTQGKIADDLGFS